MRVLKLQLLLCLLLLIVLLDFSFAKQFDECDCLKTRAERHRIIGRKYVPGNWDCSKFVQEVLNDCGISVMRCRSKDYAEGRCGFATTEIPLNKRDGCDFDFWTFPTSKGGDNGHTGMQKDRDQVYHNSYGRKRVVLDRMTWGTYLRDYLSKIRRLDPNRGKK